MKWPRWVAVVATLVALVASCSAPTTPSPSSPVPTVAAVAASDVNPVPRDRVSDGGIVRMPLRHLPAAWNPWHSAGTTAEAMRVREPISAGAFEFDAAGRPTPNPAFVAGVDVRHEGHTRVALVLNPNAVWSDGASITANDWVATWQALRGTGPGFRVVDTHGWDRVTEVRAGASNHEVVVEFAGLEPDWSRPLAAGPARAESVRDADTFNSPWPEYQAGWFAGPFVLGHVDRAQGVITLDRNPLWWGDAPKLEHVVFRTIQTEAVTAAFQHNEFDWLPVETPDRLAQVRVAPDSALRIAPGTAGRLLKLDTGGVLGDPALRAALLRALDRAAIARADVAALPEEARTWSNQLLLTNQPGYVDQAIATGLDHDRAAASEAFTKAGWPLVDGYRTKDGQRLTLTMTLDPDNPKSRTEHATVTTMLADLGITVTATSGPADLVPETRQADRYPLAGVRSITDPDVAPLVEKVATEVDPVRRADKAAQLSRALWGRSTTITLHQRPKVVAVRNGLANLGANGFGSVRWEDVGWAR